MSWLGGSFLAVPTRTSVDIMHYYAMVHAMTGVVAVTESAKFFIGIHNISHRSSHHDLLSLKWLYFTSATNTLEIWNTLSKDGLRYRRWFWRPRPLYIYIYIQRHCILIYIVTFHLLVSANLPARLRSLTSPNRARDRVVDPLSCGSPDQPEPCRGFAVPAFFMRPLKAILCMSARQGDAGLFAVIGEGEACFHECCHVYKCLAVPCPYRIPSNENMIHSSHSCATAPCRLSSAGRDSCDELRDGLPSS